MGQHWLVERVLTGRQDRNTIAKTANGIDRFAGLLLVISAALLGAGLALPIVKAENLFGLSGQFSVINLILKFLGAGQGGLAVAIALLLVILPVMITASAFDVWYKYDMATELFERRYRRLQKFTRLWILSVALVVASVYYLKTSVPDAVIFPALYALLLALIMLRLAVGRITRLMAAIDFVDSSEDD
jgi:uncharacterized paraquat-inducible protein A